MHGEAHHLAMGTREDPVLESIELSEKPIATFTTNDTITLWS